MHPTTGRSIVVDNTKTHSLLQVGGDGGANAETVWGKSAIGQPTRNYYLIIRRY